MPPTIEQDQWVRTVLGLSFDAAPAWAGEGADEERAPTGNRFTDRVKGLMGRATTTVAAADPSSPAKSRLNARLAALPDPAGATPDQVTAFEAQRSAIRTALGDDDPVADDLKTATEALAKLTGLVDACRRGKALAVLSAAKPEAGRKAKAAFDQFAAVLGDVPATPEAVAAAGADRAAQRQRVVAAVDAREAAAAMADGDAKTQAEADARAERAAAQAAYDTADAYENAMVGQAALTAALSHGPLSANTGGGFPDAVAEKLIAAYGKNARMADAAVTAATTAKYPGAVADNVGPMIDRAKSGFVTEDGDSFVSPDFAEKYGRQLLTMGGQLGPDYFIRLSSYMRSGQQFDGDPGDGDDNALDAVAQGRSRTLAAGLVRSDGSISLTSKKAKAAIGNMLFHPNALGHPTPGLNANVLRTLTMLADGTTGPEASRVLKTVKAPTDPAGLALVRGSLGKGPSAAVNDTGARQAVLTAMLRPLDQGDVGSCFVTGPARRLREVEPIKVMESYAQLATKGTYKPATGPELPAITNLPADGDPLMRSFEYTAASAGARAAKSIEHGKLSRDVALGAALLKDVATAGSAKKDRADDWTVKQAKLLKDVADAFLFTYDPTVQVGTSSDGSSSTGRYILSHGGIALTTKAAFQAAMLKVALASLGVAAQTKEATAIERIVKSDAFAAKVCPRKGRSPWELPSGGFGESSIEALHGTKVNSASVVGGAASSKVAEGDRTRQVLAAFMGSFGSDKGAMTPLETDGLHGFNALPNDPSLAVLKGSDTADIAARIKTNLLDRGEALRDTVLPADRAGWLFDEAFKREVGTPSNPALRKLADDGMTKYRPSTGLKPADVTKAVLSALAGYHDGMATQRAASWKLKEVAANKAVSSAQEAKYKNELRAEWDKDAAIGMKNALMRDLGAPQFTIADTNWGDAEGHTFFVIAPDPTTGDPLLWKRTEPPGALEPAGRDWIDRPWQTLK